MTTLKLGQLLAAVFLMFVISAAQCSPQSDESIIAQVKQTNVADIDPSIVPMSYVAWLQKIFGSNANIEWVVDDCGEGSNDAGTWPLCVTTSGKLYDHGEIVVMLSVGHSEVGAEGKPNVVTINVDGIGPSRSFNTLSQLQQYLKQQSNRQNVQTKFLDKPLGETEAVNFAKNIDIRSLLPEERSQTLSHWLEVLAGSDVISWKLDGCDQVAISMELSGYRDYRACVYAHFENKNESVLISIVVGTYRTGLTKSPNLAFTQIYNKRRINISTTHSLGELFNKLAEMRQNDPN